MDEIECGHVERLVVTYRDRLARFGVELIERTMQRNNVAFDVVFGENESGHRELGDDLLAICNYFVAKNNGRRAGALRSGGAKRPADPKEADEDRDRKGARHDEKAPIASQEGN